MLIIVTQIILPLLLLCWLLLLPAAGSLSYTVQALAVAAALLGLTFAALWAMPPFWVPYVYLFLLLVIVALQLFTGRAGGSGVWAAGAAQTGAIVLAGIAGIAGAYLFITALLGRLPPDLETVDIASPFPAGTYLVAHGGASTMVNAHLGTLNPEQPRFRPWRGQSRALDLFRINAAGIHMQGWYSRDPARYETFGTPLLAPCAGTVALVVDGVPDNPVPVMNREQMAGNYVAIHCGDQRYVVLAHFRNGSIRAQSGQQLAVGDYLGEAGNSGNSSEPHLHVHAQRGLPDDNPLGGEPLVLTIDGRYPVRNDRLHVP